MRFKSRRGGIEVTTEPYETELLREWATGLQRLLEPAPADEPEDPLAALVGLSTGEVSRPEDPALARLLPDGYRDDDEAAADFRRYTERDLRRAKQAHAQVVADTVPPGGGTALLTRAQADAWLGWTNDVRLVLAVRLDLPQDHEPADLADDDPDRHATLVYHWLTANQYALLKALGG